MPCLSNGLCSSCTPVPGAQRPLGMCRRSVISTRAGAWTSSPPDSLRKVSKPISCQRQWPARPHCEYWLNASSSGYSFRKCPIPASHHLGDITDRDADSRSNSCQFPPGGMFDAQASSSAGILRTVMRTFPHKSTFSFNHARPPRQARSNGPLPAERFGACGKREPASRAWVPFRRLEASGASGTTPAGDPGDGSVGAIADSRRSPARRTSRNIAGATTRADATGSDAR